MAQLQASVIWQVNSDNLWKDLDEDTSEQLNARLRAGTKHFKVKSKGHHYDVDLVDPAWRWTSLRSGLISNLRLWKPQAGVAGVAAWSELNGQDKEPSPGHAGQGVSHLDRVRISVWRRGEWHPIPLQEAAQIKKQFADGRAVFEVKGKHSDYKVDTRGKSGWIQILHNGRKRPMRYLDATSDGPTLVGLGLIDHLETEWAELTNGDEFLTVADLLMTWKKADGEGFRGKGSRELLAFTAVDLMDKLTLGMDRHVRQWDWIHFRLLREQAPSYHALQEVNDALIPWLHSDPHAIKKLVALFTIAIRGSGDAQLTAAQMQEAADQWISHGGDKNFRMTTVKNYFREIVDVSRGLQRGRIETDLDDGRVCDEEWIADCCGGTRDKGQNRKDTLMDAYRDQLKYLEEYEADEEEPVTYYDYVNMMLERTLNKVQIARYDLSRGLAKYLGPMLLGKNLQGLWHTGIIVHEKEYWYGGNIFESDPGMTPFGEPVSVELIGGTMRTREDLWSHINSRLVDEFTPENYDVFAHNSNHFSNSVCLFLTNHPIPDKILSLEETQETWSLLQLRPHLNTSLGSFGRKGVEGSVWMDGTGNHRSTDCMAEEWEYIKEGTFVEYEYEHGWPSIAYVSARQEQTCTVRWLDVANQVVSEMEGVSRLHVKRLKKVKRATRPPPKSPGSVSTLGAFPAQGEASEGQPTETGAVDAI